MLPPARRRCGILAGILRCCRPCTHYVTSLFMAIIKANTEVIKKALKGGRKRFSIAGHEGLYLHTRPELDAKGVNIGNGSYLIRYRLGNTRRFHTLHRDARNATLENVIEAKNKWLDKVNLEKVDPKAELEQQRDLTFDALFRQWVEQHAKQHKRSWRDDVARYETHIQSRIGHMEAASLTRRDVIAAVAGIAADKSPSTATRCLPIISVVFTWAVTNEIVEQHPALRVPKPSPKMVRERVLAYAELAALWNALQKIASGETKAPMTPRLARALQLIMLTGARRSEVANAPAAEIAGDLWSIPATRMKGKRAHVVPLAPMAEKLFEVSIADALGSPLTFPGRKGGTLEPMSLNHALGRLAAQIKLADVTPHDLRRTMASEMGRIGVPEGIIGRCLAHTQSSVTATHYNQYAYLDERRRAYRLWQARLINIASGRKLHVLRWHA